MSVSRGIDQLFSAGNDEQLAEKDLGAAIFEIVQRFFREENSNPAIGEDALRRLFVRSTVPETPTPLNAYLGDLSGRVVKYSTHVSSPRYIGHMTSALPNFVRPLSMLVTGLNQNPVKIETARAVTPLEREVLAMLHREVYQLPDDFYDRCVQDPDSTLGVITSGGTLANVTALWSARNQRLGPDGAFKGVEEEGMAAAMRHYGFDGACVIGSSLMQYSLEKAVGLMGLGRRGLMTVPVDRRHRIDLRRVRKAINEARSQKLCILALVAIAGATDGGSVDPIEAMAEIAETEGLHYHVDAAWGGPILFSDKHRGLLKGIERADSVTLDGHKQLYCPMGVGGVFFRDPGMARVIEKTAQYVVREGSADLGRRSLEGSRGGMSIYLHAALSLLGRQGFAYLIDEGIRKVRYMANRVQRSVEFELLQQPEINMMLYRYLPKLIRERAANGELNPADQERINKYNKELQQTQRENGRTFVSRTTLDERFEQDPNITALRVVIANPLTSEEDIDETLADQLQIAEKLEAMEC